MRSSLINEKIRNKDGKLTRFKTGWWFVFINISDRPLERTVNIGGFTTCLYTRNSRGLIHSRQRAPGAWREVISSPHVQTTSGAESAVRMVQSAMLSLCGGHKAVWDSKETPWSPSSGNPRPPGLQHQGPPDPQASNIREPLTPRSPTPGNPRSSTRHLTTRLPEMTRTSGGIPSWWLTNAIRTAKSVTISNQ